MIKAVFFDLYDTLVKRTPGGLETAQRKAVRFLRKCGYAVSYEEFLFARESYFRDHLTRILETLDEPNIYTWFGGILSRLSIPVNYDRKFLEEMYEEYSRGLDHFRNLYPEVKLILNNLKSRFRLGLISNSMGEGARRDLKSLGIYNCFDGIFISSEVGKRKPHPKIFNEALNSLGVKLEESVHIGDDPWEDIFGAKRVGMKAILVMRKTVAREEGKVEPDATVKSLREIPEIIKSFQRAINCRPL